VTADLEAIGIDERVAAVGGRLARRAGHLTADITEVIDAAIPALRGDEAAADLLLASVHDNVTTALNLMRFGSSATTVDAPLAAVDYARLLAQRDVSSVALIRAYRVGQTRLVRRCIEDLIKHTEGDPLQGAASLRIVEMVSDYVDNVVEQLVGAYDRARDEWLQSRGDALILGLRSILDDDGLTTPSAQSRLGNYSISQFHVGLVVRTERTPEAASVSSFRQLADGLADRLECRERPLFVPYDDHTSWIWLPMGGRSHIHRELVAPAITAAPGVNASIGEPGESLEGFRRTHAQAVAAQSVAITADPPIDGLTAFADVGPVTFMCNDLVAARAWIAEALGGLAVDSPRCARLRETAYVFLSSGGSYSAAAEQLTLHRNTAQYRVRTAEEVRGRPLRDGRFDVELALLGCKWLGRTVLQQPFDDDQVAGSDI
jgi:hypothetical protein